MKPIIRSRRAAGLPLLALAALGLMGCQQTGANGGALVNAGRAVLGSNQSSGVGSNGGALVNAGRAVFGSNQSSGVGSNGGALVNAGRAVFGSNQATGVGSNGGALRNTGRAVFGSNQATGVGSNGGALRNAGRAVFGRSNYGPATTRTYQAIPATSDQNFDANAFGKASSASEQDLLSTRGDQVLAGSNTSFRNRRLCGTCTNS